MATGPGMGSGCPRVGNDVQIGYLLSMTLVAETFEMPRVRVRRFRACHRKRALWKKSRVDRRVGGDPVNGVDRDGRSWLDVGAMLLAAPITGGLGTLGGYVGGSLSNKNWNPTEWKDNSSTWEGMVAGEAVASAIGASGGMVGAGVAVGAGTVAGASLIGAGGLSAFAMGAEGIKQYNRDDFDWLALAEAWGAGALVGGATGATAELAVAAAPEAMAGATPSIGGEVAYWGGTSLTIVGGGYTGLNIAKQNGYGWSDWQTYAWMLLGADVSSLANQEAGSLIGQAGPLSADPTYSYLGSKALTMPISSLMSSYVMFGTNVLTSKNPLKASSADPGILGVDFLKGFQFGL